MHRYITIETQTLTHFAPGSVTHSGSGSGRGVCGFWHRRVCLKVLVIVIYSRSFLNCKQHSSRALKPEHINIQQGFAVDAPTTTERSNCNGRKSRADDSCKAKDYELKRMSHTEHKIELAKVVFRMTMTKNVPEEYH